MDNLQFQTWGTSSSCSLDISSSSLDDLEECIELIPDAIWNEIDDIIDSVARADNSRSLKQTSPPLLSYTELDYENDYSTSCTFIETDPSDNIWQDIDDIINRTETQNTPVESKQKICRKRKYRSSCVETKPGNMDNIKENESPSDLSTPYVKPKKYKCGYCYVEFYNMSAHLKHLRYHREDELRHGYSRCNNCSLLFRDVIDMKWHQTLCVRRSHFRCLRR